MTLRNETATFSWIPFSGFLQGSMLVNSTVLCQKLFVLGSMAFLLCRDHLNRKLISIVIALALISLEILQKWIASGTPEITDPLLFIAIVWLFSTFVRHETAPRESGQRMPASEESATAGGVANSSVSVMQAAQILRQYLPKMETVSESTPAYVLSANKYTKRVAIGVGIYCISGVFLLKILLNMPSMPYNVAELFGFGGDGFDLLFFILATLSLGWGGAWLGMVLVSTEKPVRDIPVALIKLAFVIYALLWLSVTRESIKDITGSTVFVRRVAEQGVLGEPGVQVLALLGRDNVSAVTVFFEPAIRLGALIGPLFIFSGLCFFAWLRVTNAAKRQLSKIDYMLAIICLLLCLYLSKVIAFDWSSTDNLYELIAPDGPWGIGGGGYLYLLTFLFCALSAFISWAYFRGGAVFSGASVIVVLCVPISWLLLNHGLENDVGKYGHHFSGVDFLLGPDRKNLISSSELFFRWSVLHLIIVFGLAYGSILYLYWIKSKLPVESTKTRSLVPLKFRVYEQQWSFLHELAIAMNLSVPNLVQVIIAYMGHEMASSPGSRDMVQRYIAESSTAHSMVFSPAKLEAKLPSEAIDIIALADPNTVHSESRVFRKMLEIFIAASEGQADQPPGSR
ncbi:MAG: hypothetical protein V7709_01610 [Halioglobus sp.]